IMGSVRMCCHFHHPHLVTTTQMLLSSTLLGRHKFSTHRPPRATVTPASIPPLPAKDSVDELFRNCLQPRFRRDENWKRDPRKPQSGSRGSEAMCTTGRDQARQNAVKKVVTSVGSGQSPEPTDSAPSNERTKLVDAAETGGLNLFVRLSCSKFFSKSWIGDLPQRRKSVSTKSFRSDLKLARLI